ncbi:MAG: branched-chain amino acid aminotransferase [Rickettsiales bacterium]|nr:branched-chain amino acid aminotransferase [Rickettsiales bacterium]
MTIIPFDDRDGVIWYNGKLVPWRDATTHILCHGLHYASSVFEGERVYNGQVFKLTEHSERLRKSAELIGFEVPYTTQELDEATKLIVKEQNITNGYVRPVAWRGSEMMAISAQHNKIHVAIATWEWPNLFKADARETGIRMITADWKRPSPDTEPSASKAAGLYMICTMSKHKAEAAGYHDALMLDWRGYVAEATGANIFFVMNGELHTPTPDCFLDGITRRTVIDLAKERGIKVVERHIKPEEITSASEVFLTGTAAEITPVAEIDGHTYEVGAISKQLMDDYHNLVRTPA